MFIFLSQPPIGRFVVSCSICVALAACGADAQFGSNPLKHSKKSGTNDSAAPINSTSDDGDNGVQGDDATKNESSEKGAGSKPVTLAASHSLFMSWGCPDGSQGPNAVDSAQMLVAMPGSYILPVIDDHPVTLVNSGTYCNPAKARRDIVFVIDVSDSMRSGLNLGHDRVKDGTCGRVTAVDSVLATLDDSARVALVTFDDGVKRDSGGFISPAELRANYLKVDILCESGSGTKYLPALARTEQILKGRRPSAAAEVYFVSDGRPHDGANDGAAEAARIRLQATIATMMLKGDDTVLINKIASKDPQGNPLHGKVDTAEAMAAKLKTLSESSLLSVAIAITDAAGAAIAKQEWQVSAAGSDLSFITPSLDVLPGDHTNGLNFSVKYLDSRGGAFTQAGHLAFAP